MTDPMSPEELKACRERAEAATAGPWSTARHWTRAADQVIAELEADSGNKASWYVCGEAEKVDNGALADVNAAFIAHARTDVPRLLATIAARDEEIARLRDILSSIVDEIGDRRLVDAWKLWRRLATEIQARVAGTIRAMADEQQRKIDALPSFSEPGTLNPTRERHIVARGTLDAAASAIEAGAVVCDHDVVPVDAHWGRCTKCGDDTFPLSEEAAWGPGGRPRKPVAGWGSSERPGALELSTGLEAYNRGHLIAYAAPSDGEFIFEIETDDVEGSQHEYQWVRGFESLEAAQLAAEDALFAIADAINALRGGR